MVMTADAVAREYWKLHIRIDNVHRKRYEKWKSDKSNKMHVKRKLTACNLIHLIKLWKKNNWKI